MFIECLLALVLKKAFAWHDNPGTRLHNVAHTARRLPFNISRKAPCDCIAKRNDGNEEDNDEETNIARFDFESLQRRRAKIRFQLRVPLDIFHFEMHLEDYLQNGNF